MSFFSSIPEAPEPEETREPYRRPPSIFGPSPDELGRPISDSFVLARSDSAAVLVQTIRVHSTGCFFELQWIVRRTTESASEWERGGRTEFGGSGRHFEQDGLLIGIGFSDGAVARTNDPFDRREPGAGPRLVTAGGSSSGGDSERRHGDRGLWLLGLPPLPTMELVCAWPRYGIPETRRTVDTGAIHEAAGHVAWVWPEDADLAEMEL